ncbi:NUDIX hydrolase [Flammeovirga kamogawensis]|uniref:NUDIX hydrolase n=1 Tax=Flammeovirga kamogawensis TaxID=373891 RepID=A0ABX8GUB8_9BACT|nr:NUDIX domain-containing protein [Flammeovirga kamogawensis]MBB6459786.1 ADP-ribose pyrophosphatase YjhB (NUDIX family) [Flammeovirga kamogawensis]QWG07156.1 NUDIX hydrolase [Flammeovirga kamogawensis]TRX68978.1 NUDIX hydrolase [Flammeovirga kamogawensis]
MNEYYNSAYKPLLAIDCVIFGYEQGELKVLLTRRKQDPYKGAWGLATGFLHFGESLHYAAERVLKKQTGLDRIYMDQLSTFGEVDRDPEARVISLVYYALIKVESQTLETLEKNQAQWFSITSLPKLMFDHETMIQMSWGKLRRKSRYQPIGFELLPEKFTLPELQSLYEAIHQKQFDKRNFRKKILATGLLKKLDEKQKGVSKKGAYYYVFEEGKYDELISQGFNFELKSMAFGS